MGERRMLEVGVSGGVASGKSTVAALLAARGAAVLDADAVVATLYRPGAAGAAAVAELFGNTVLAADGGVDHGWLAELILDRPGARRRLEAAIHPLVRSEVARWLAEQAGADRPPAVAVVEAALLVETGAYKEYDRLVVVTTALETRRTRAVAGGWAASTFARTVAAQTSDARREAVADYVVHNDGDREVLAAAVDRLWSLLIEDAEALAAGRPLPPRTP